MTLGPIDGGAVNEPVSMVTRIVVGWDGTPDADAAVRWAADRLRAESPDLRVTTSTEHGSPSAVLAEYLDDGTLVVVGAPAQHQGSRWTVGSRLAGRRGGGTVAVIPSAPTTNARSAWLSGSTALRRRSQPSR